MDIRKLDIRTMRTLEAIDARLAAIETAIRARASAHPDPDPPRDGAEPER